MVHANLHCVVSSLFLADAVLFCLRARGLQGWALRRDGPCWSEVQEIPGGDLRRLALPGEKAAPEGLGELIKVIRL
ncbi:hypothetical protein [Sorangium sp. So ce362]|uniref:hypothetical protein n=1 Tax=Sorangium sp. So ce362 TaxID=3133303 RepID=UPI003F61D7F7